MTVEELIDELKGVPDNIILIIGCRAKELRSVLFYVEKDLKLNKIFVNGIDKILENQVKLLIK